MAPNPKSIKKKQDLGRSGILFSLARVPKSERIVYGTSDFKLYDEDLAAEKSEPVALEGHSSYVMGVAYTGKHFVSGAYDGKLIWWDAESGEQVRKVDAHKKWIRGVAASPDGKLVASISDDMVCRTWDAESGKLRHELKGHEESTPHHYPSMLYALTISADGKYLATGDKVGHVVVWELETGKEVASVEAPENYTWDPRARRHSIGGVRSVAFSHDSKQLAVGGMGKVGNIDHLGGKARVEIFDWQKGERTHDYGDNEFKGLVERLAFHPSGDWLIAAGGDHSGFLMFFDMREKKAIVEEKAPMHVHDLAFAEDYKKLYTVGHGKIATWQMEG